MSYRIYYALGNYGYSHGDARHMSYYYNDNENDIEAPLYLEADTMEELKKRIEEFTIEHTNKAADCISLEQHKIDETINRIMIGDFRSTRTLETEHEIFRFITPIMQIAEEFDADAHRVETNTQFNERVIARYVDHKRVIYEQQDAHRRAVAERKAALAADPIMKHF